MKGPQEVAEAVRMWGRSLDHKLRYINFISDGDSASYANVLKMNDGEGRYGREHQVIK